MIHVTELSDQAFGKVEDVVSKGDDVTAKVIKLDPEHKKIALSIKEYLIDQNQYNRDDIVVTPAKKRKKEEGKDSEGGGSNQEQEQHSGSAQESNE